MPVALLSFFAKPIVRYLGGALLAVLVMIFVVHKWHGYQESLRQEGREQMAEQVAQVVKQNDLNNRKLEQGLQTVLEGYGNRLDLSLQRMDARSQKHADTVTRIIEKQPEIFNNPVCTTPPEIIDERNKIRAEGPK